MSDASTNYQDRSLEEASAPLLNVIESQDFDFPSLDALLAIPLSQRKAMTDEQALALLPQKETHTYVRYQSLRRANLYPFQCVVQLMMHQSTLNK